MHKFAKAAQDLGELVNEKNIAYGDSIADSAKFLRLLFPDGIPTERYPDVLLITRVFDKLKRIATRKDAFGESPWHDIAGYALRGFVDDSEHTEKEEYPETQYLTCPAHKTLLKSFSPVGPVVSWLDTYCPECIAEILKEDIF